MSALTIGVFDGVHRGHQLLIDHLIKTKCPPIVVTFSNHPMQTLKGFAPPLLTAPPIKLALLKEYGVEKTISLPFTRNLANLTYEEFLAPYPIRHLILGEDSSFGKGGLGTPETLQTLGEKRGFTVHALPRLLEGEIPISSTQIRRLIQAGKLDDAQTLLGRPHCFYYSPDIPPRGPVALPPDGEYQVWVQTAGKIEEATLIIKDRIPRLPQARDQLVSFGPNINPSLFEIVCPISPAVL